jgi:hypothetical protein
MEVIPVRPTSSKNGAVDEGTITNPSTTPDDSRISVESRFKCCPECGNPVLGLEDRITCSRAEEAGCNFTITVKEFENTLYASLSPFLVEVLTNVTSSQELLHDMGRSPERKTAMEFESLMECNVGIDLWVVKDYADVWTIGIAYKQYFADDEGK